MADPVRTFCQRAQKFRDEAHSILARYESTPSRIISLADTRRQVADLSLYQKALFDEAIECVEKGCFRAAHVMAWAAFMDYLERKIASDGLKKVKAVKSAWSKFKNVEDLREHIAEYQLIDAAKDVGLLSKTETKTLHGLLSKRNECAHPSNHDPDMNEAIGYISELLRRIKRLEKKSL